MLDDPPKGVGKSITHFNDRLTMNNGQRWDFSRQPPLMARFWTDLEVSDASKGRDMGQLMNAFPVHVFSPHKRLGRGCNDIVRTINHGAATWGMSL